MAIYEGKSFIGAIILNTMFILLTWMSLFGPLIAYAGTQGDCHRKIVFLPQTHATDGRTSHEMSNDALDRVAASQLKVANYIENRPDLAVFTEQMTASDFKMSSLEHEKRLGLRELMDTVFPNGLPNHSSRLNALQRQKLYDNGGEFIQLMRGRLSMVHRVLENEEIRDQIFDPIDSWFRINPPGAPYPPEIGHLVYGAREKQALFQINKFFGANPDQRSVILIFGANHNFSFYPDLFPSHCVIIPPNFQNDWTGRFREGPHGFPMNTFNGRAAIPLSNTVE